MKWQLRLLNSEVNFIVTQTKHIIGL